MPNYAMRRTDLQNTELWVHRKRIELVRQMTPRELLERTNALIVDLRELRKRTEHPHNPHP